jgi:uncharacterized glyoxalase superfamily protein PhnB
MPEARTATRQAVPMLSYEDVAGAIEFLGTAFGFVERGERFTDDSGRVTHAEMDLEGAFVMLGWPGPEYRSPRHHAETCEDSRAWLDVPFVVDGVLVEVADVDAHLERARAAGAEILREPRDEPYGRRYNAADPEGHRWMFLQPPS